MPNRRNKDRNDLTISIRGEHKTEINEYLSVQKNLTATVQLALLLVSKYFGKRDLVQAYQDYALKNISNLSGLSETKVVVNNNDEIPIKEENKKKIEKKKPDNVSKAIENHSHKKHDAYIKKEDSYIDNMDPEEINKLFYSGDSNDL
ncbi:hypothetical protein [uncultured Lactobacillus sp.]|uniref:hypothetical protein n=1 Tax=uncultured Lactobacillus sp. TaxID=153152 RepID=UPI0026269732|nr:hypothetical protein [uncultured Lactobacillus sp.]